MSMRNRPSGTAAGLLLGIWAATLASSVAAQYTEMEVGGLIAAPREAQRLLADASAAVEKQQWTEAIQGFGILLGIEAAGPRITREAHDFFVEQQSTNGKIRKSIRSIVLEQLNMFPEEGQRLLELRYGIDARREFEKGLEAGDWKRVREIAQKFGFTQAGREATWLLVEHYVERGDLEYALQWGNRLFESSAARREIGSGLGVMLAVLSKNLGRDAQSQFYLTKAREFWPNQNLEWGGQPLRPGADGLFALDSLQISPTASRSPQVREWLWPGGRLDQNGQSAADSPTTLVAWDARLHDSVQSEEGVMQVFRKKLSEDSSLIPSRVPLIAGSHAIMQTYDQRVVAFDLRNGRLSWQSPYSGMPIALPRNRFAATLDLMRSSEPTVQSYLVSRIWGETSTGQLTSDGDRLFVISDISALEAAENLVLDAAVTRTQRQELYNVLRAWSRVEEGKLLWEVGGETGLSEPALSGVLFLGPPLPYEGELLILGELNGEVNLFGLAPESGRLHWSQQLVANNVTPIATEPKRRHLSCMPSVIGGTVLCPTLSGYLVAFDLTTRSIRWAINYGDTRRFNPRANAFGFNQAEPFDPFSPRSAVNTPLVGEGVVVHAPSESDTIYAVDLQTGNQIWAGPRGEVRYPAGIWNGKVLFIGERFARAIDLRSGESAWDSNQLDFEPGERCVGIGVRNGGRYWVPLSGQTIAEMDIDRGQMVHRTKVESQLGNLVSDGNLILSCSPFELSAYWIQDRLRSFKHLDSADTEEPSTASQAALANLLLSAGKLDEALDQAILAYRKDPQDSDLQLLIQKIGLEALRENFDKYINKVSEFDSLMVLSPQRRLYFIGLVDGFIKRGENLRAFQELVKFSDERRFEPSSKLTGGNLIQWRDGWSIDIDRWLNVTARRIYELASDSDRQRMEQIIETHVREEQNRTARNAEFIRIFGFVPGTEELEFRFAESAIDAGRYLVAERILLGLAEQTHNAEVATRSAVELVRMYKDCGRYTAAFRAAVYFHLSPERIAAHDRSTRQNHEWGLPPVEMLDDDGDELRRIAVPTIEQWPSGRVVAEKLANTMTRELHATTTGFCPVSDCGGIALRNWFCQSTMQGFLFSNPLTSEAFFCQLARGRSLPEQSLARTLDSLIILEMPSELVAFDSLRPGSDGEIVWRQSFDDSPGVASFRNLAIERDRWGRGITRARRGFRVLGASTQAIVISTRDELIALDPLTGQRVWSRVGFSKSVAGSVAGNRLYVLDSTLGRRSILDVRDGQLISQVDWTGTLSILSTQGSKFLLDTGAPESSKPGKLQLFDADAGKVLLELEVARKSVAEVADSEFLVVWQPDGTLFTWDLRNAKQYEEKGDPWRQPIDYMTLMRFEDRLVLLPFGTNYAVDASLTTVEISQTYKVGGPVTALRTSDGKFAWSAPVEVLKASVPCLQSRQVPGLMFVRRVKWHSENSKVQEEIISMYAIDVRSGKLVYHNDNLGRTSSMAPIAMVIDPTSGSLEIGTFGQAVRLTWTDEPIEGSTPTAIGCLSRDELEAWLQTQPRRNSERTEFFEDR